MKTFEVKESNGVRDIIPNKFVYDANALNTLLKARCRVLKTELPYNTNLGVPLNLSKNNTDLAILNIIQTTPGVTGAQIIESNLVNREYKAKIRVKYGGTVIELTV